jgi:enoyl-CoA hydratase/carnithine racemase
MTRAAPPAADAGPAVLHAREGGVVTLTLNRGARLNQLTAELLGALQAQLDAVARDPQAHAVVLAAAGPHFCAGHGLQELRDHPEPAWRTALFEQCSRLMLTLVQLPQPVIARVHGAAVAAGCQLVSMCDLAIASASARFALPGIKSGLFCSTPAVGVARSISRKRALELLLTGEMIDAATAEHWGLVNRAVPPERLDAEVSALARSVAAHSPAVVRLGKRLFYEQIEQSMAAAYASTSQGMVENLQLADAAEGIDAFLDKRAPLWRSR